MMRFSIIPLVLMLLVAAACQKVEEPGTAAKADTNGYWLVPFDEILYWGDPPDRIQSIDDPHFEPVSESHWKQDDRMLVSHYNGHIKAYPIAILEAHEIVNDHVGDFYFAVTYCPLTGSGMSWNRTIEGEVTEFGVSGMLFRDNLIPYDRNTGSYWSQMRNQCVHGEHIESVPRPGMIFETDFRMLSSYFPSAEILTGSSGNACTDSTCNLHLSSIPQKSAAASNDHIQPGEYYYGLINRDRAKLFGMDMFEPGVRVYSFGFSGKKMIVAGNKAMNVVVSFETTGSAAGEMTALQDQFPVIMEDGKGNVYDIFGRVATGPQKGNELTPAMGYRAKGFAWESLFESAEIYKDQ